MPKSQEVVIVGKSLVLAELAAALKDNSKFRLTQLELPVPEAATELGLIAPDVIIFEMNDANAPGIGSLLRGFPGVKLIGLVIEKASLVVITSGEQTVQNMSDLAQVITG